MVNERNVVMESSQTANEHVLKSGVQYACYVLTANNTEYYTIIQYLITDKNIQIFYWNILR